MASHIPAGFSFLQLVHYGQLTMSGRFCRFNYLKSENLIRYGTPEPPDYNLKNVRAPVALHLSVDDIMSDPGDTMKLKRILPNVILYRIVPKDGFNHFDFLYAINVKTLLYDSVIEVILNYDK